MANQSKRKGTAFESAVVKYLRSRSGDDRIERRALHGAQDLGDIFGLRARGLEGIVECKAYKSFSDGLVERWREQAVCERGNADAGFCLLVIKRHQHCTADSRVDVTLADLMAITGAGPCPEGADGVWVSLLLCDACDIMWDI